MADIFTKEKRSEIMSKIKGKNTSLEIRFRKHLSRAVYPLGYRYRLHCKKLPGRPDVVFVGQKIAIFVDGDFWHGYRYEKQKARLPEKYWQQKIANNIKRDQRNFRKLRRMGWTVVRFWEHDIKKAPDKCIGKVLAKLFKTE